MKRRRSYINNQIPSLSNYYVFIKRMRVIKNKHKHIQNTYALLNNLPTLHYFITRAYVQSRVSYPNNLQINAPIYVSSALLSSNTMPGVLNYYVLSICMLLK